MNFTSTYRTTSRDEDPWDRRVLVYLREAEVDGAVAYWPLPLVSPMTMLVADEMNHVVFAAAACDAIGILKEVIGRSAAEMWAAAEEFHGAALVLSIVPREAGDIMDELDSAIEGMADGSSDDRVGRLGAVFFTRAVERRQLRQFAPTGKG